MVTVAAAKAEAVDPVVVEAPVAADPNGCRACGATPAADVKFRSNTGMVFRWRMSTYDGPWCRDCGKAIYRKAMNHTLLAGWWGVISFFANLYFILQNVVAYPKVRGLGEPHRAADRTQLPAGKLLFQRAGIYVAVVVVSVVGFIGIGAATADTPQEAVAKLPGKCVTFKASDTGQRRIADTVDCAKPHDGLVVGVVSVLPDACPQATTTVFKFAKEDSTNIGDIRYICVNEDG